MNSQVNINFEIMAFAVREYARRKATEANGSIIYVENGQVIEENLKSNTKIVLKKAEVFRLVLLS